MYKCPFCNINMSKIYNTVFEESKNFIVMCSKGALTDGYILIVSKKHVYSIFELNDDIKKEYFSLINKYREKFKKIYNKYPIIFEHGSCKNSKNSVNSITHAHSHIVNHNFINESEFLTELNFETFKNVIRNKSYIFYISPNNKYYISYNYENVSQLIRIYIARDLDIENNYDWNNNEFTENIIKTINKIKNC